MPGSARVAGSPTEQLADELESVPYEQFIERWRTQPLFADEPPEVNALAREDQRRNRPEALAAVLRGVGTGEMAPLWGRLGELAMPVTLVVGERDAKFLALGQRALPMLREGSLRRPARGPRGAARGSGGRRGGDRRRRCCPAAEGGPCGRRAAFVSSRRPDPRRSPPRGAP